MAGKTALLASITCGLLCSQPLWAQAADDNDAVPDDAEEIIVRGRRLADFRAELQAARVRVYALFNDLNSDDAFDVLCHVEDSTGTRMRQDVCRPQFKDEISAAAARAWVGGIKDSCPQGLTQDCIFGNALAASQGKSGALAEESWEPVMQKRFAIEMARVVADNPEMQQAILDYEAVERAYDDVRGGRRGRDCDGPEPPRRCSR
jgi:hypothetical protein